MASVMNNDEKTMATDVVASGAEEPEDRRPPQRSDKAEPRQGFFTIYKKGQGYWTRICSAGAAALLVLLTAQFLFTQLPPNIPWFNNHRGWLWGIVVGVIAATTILIWRLMNNPGNVDFLIATDSEMKKVNWTSRKELIGSTKVVIFFMFVIAISLFVIDLLFGYLFYLLRVLKTPPL